MSVNRINAGTDGVRKFGTSTSSLFSRQIIDDLLSDVRFNSHDAIRKPLFILPFRYLKVGIQYAAWIHLIKIEHAA